MKMTTRKENVDNLKREQQSTIKIAKQSGDLGLTQTASDPAAKEKIL